MVELVYPPDPRSLLPPLLACLPTAFVSPHPPPVLLPLLSPILRQRVQILSSVSPSPSDSWLRLLCWDAAKAEQLQELVDGTCFEPHPVSGEIELPGDVPVSYKRVDEETLQSRILLPDYNLKAIYLWCPNDKDGGGPGWRVAELLPGEGCTDDDATWFPSIGEANSQSKEKIVEDALRAAERNDNGASQEEEDDDGDYWARYDATPGRTPNPKSPGPTTLSSLQRPGMAQDSYFSQYDDVQPAMDNHDPSESQPEIGTSSLNGDMLASLLRPQVSGAEASQQPRANGYPTDGAIDVDRAMLLNHPRPSSTPSTSSDAVGRLEQEAESHSAYEVGVKQHISSNLKSLFRLARCTGISREEFQDLVKTELELLNLSDDE